MFTSECKTCGTVVNAADLMDDECASCAAIVDYSTTGNTIEFVAKGMWAVDVHVMPDDFEQPLAEGVSAWITDNWRLDLPKGFKTNVKRVNVMGGSMNAWATLSAGVSEDGSEIVGLSVKPDDGVVDAWIAAGCPKTWTGVTE